MKEQETPALCRSVGMNVKLISNGNEIKSSKAMQITGMNNDVFEKMCRNKQNGFMVEVIIGEKMWPNFILMIISIAIPCYKGAL